MENNYSGAVKKAKEAVSAITKEVEILDNKLKSTIAQLEKYGTSQIPSKTTDQLKQQSAQIEKLTQDILKLNEANVKKKKATDDLRNAEGQLIATVQQKIDLNNALRKQWEKEVAGQQKLLVAKEKEIKAKAKATEASRKEAEAAKKLLEPYNQLLIKQKQLKNELQNLIARGKQAGQSQRAYNKELRTAQLEYKKVTSRVNLAKKAVSNFGNTSMGGLVRSVKNLVGAFGLIGGATLFAGLIKDAFKLVKTLDSMAFSMKAVITDSRELGQTQVWLRQIAEDFGAELVTVTNRYIKFRAAATQANFSADETQKIFGTMTKAAGVLGLKTDELQGVFLALEQMISKGKITTEELRRQLGERLPGAMDIMADSMGVTTAQLDEMLKKGEVITKDVLPAFADQIEIAFGLDSVARVETLQASTARLKNAWTILVEEFNKGNSTSKILMNIINLLAKNLGKIVEIVVAGAKVFGVYKAVLIVTNLVQKAYNGNLLLTARYQVLVAESTIRTALATKSFSKAMVILSRAMLTNPIFLTIAALGALYLAFSDTTPSVSEATEALIKNGQESLKVNEAFNKTTDSVEELYERYKILNKRLEENKEETKLSVAEQKELETIIGKIGLILPGTVNDVDMYTKAIALNTKEVEANIKARNLDTGKSATQDVVEQEESLKRLQELRDIEVEKIKKGNRLIIEENDKKYEFLKKGDELYVKTKDDLVFKKVNSAEREIFNEKTARTKKQIDDLEKLIFANKLLAFETTGAFAEETKAYREKEAQRKKEAQDIEDEFNKKTILSTKQEAVAKAQLERDKALGVDKLKNEEGYAEAVSAALNTVINKQDDAYQSAKENLEKAKKDLQDFTGVDPDKKPKTDDAAARKAEADRKRAAAEQLKADKLALKSAEEFAQSKLKISAQTNQAIFDDENASMGRRIVAARDLADDLNDAAKSKRDYEKALAQLTITDETALNAKLLAIDNDYTVSKAKNEEQRLANTKIAFDRMYELRSQEFERAKQQQETEGNDALIGVNTQYDKDLAALKESFDKGEISRKTYNERRVELERAYQENLSKVAREGAIQRLKDEIENAKRLAELMPTDTEEARNAKADALANISNIEMALSDMVTANNIANIETEEQAFERLQAKRMEIITTASNNIAEALNLDSENLQALFLDVADGFGKTADDILQTISNVTAVAGDIMAAVYERNIEQIDEQITANNDYYANILDNENLSTEQRDAIEAQRDAKEAILEKKKREEKTKAAKLEKIMAIADIGIKLAQTIVAINLAAASIDAITFGVGGSAYRVSQIPLAIGLAAVQVGAIAAQPIPKFATGTMDAPQGWAMVDENVPEVHTDKRGNIKSLGMGSPNLRYLEKGDKIYKSHEDFFNYGNMDSMERAIWNMNMESNGGVVTQTQMDAALISQMSGMRSDMSAMGKRIEKLASRPIKNTVKVELEDKRAY